MQTSGNSVLSNLQFDMISVLHNKGEGLAAYDKYIQDAQHENSQECVQLLERLKQQDQQAISEIKQHVSQLLQSASMETSSSARGMSGSERSMQ